MGCLFVVSKSFESSVTSPQRTMMRWPTAVRSNDVKKQRGNEATKQRSSRSVVKQRIRRDCGCVSRPKKSGRWRKSLITEGSSESSCDGRNGVWLSFVSLRTDFSMLWVLCSRFVATVLHAVANHDIVTEENWPFRKERLLPPVEGIYVRTRELSTLPAMWSWRILVVVAGLVSLGTTTATGVSIQSRKNTSFKRTFPLNHSNSHNVLRHLPKHNRSEILSMSNESKALLLQQLKQRKETFLASRDKRRAPPTRHLNPRRSSTSAASQVAAGQEVSVCLSPLFTSPSPNINNCSPTTQVTRLFNKIFGEDPAAENFISRAQASLEVHT